MNASEIDSKEMLGSAKRIVVKIGSALLVDPDSGGVQQEWLDGLASDVAMLRNHGAEVVLVSSGSIALGRHRLRLPPRELTLEESQAAAAVGQVQLARAWGDALAAKGFTSAQVLVTLGDTENRRRYLNARSTMQMLLRLGIIPIVNENDTVATDEIRYGDNDRLAAGVALMVSADRLVLLSDIDGLYSADPNVDPDATHVPRVAELSTAIESMAGESNNSIARGGMKTKIMAARTAMKGGCAMAIALGTVQRPLFALNEGAKCTWFLASDSPQAARKRWIGGMAPKGRVWIDDGAQLALREGKSLLPPGVLEIEGQFERGDPVTILNSRHESIAIGLIGYPNRDAAKIAGRQSRDIESILGYSGQSEMVHRDDMAL